MNAHERRRLRNRESALASRKRKRERMEYLEEENERLSLENERLSQRLLVTEQTSLEIMNRLRELENRENERGKRMRVVEKVFDGEYFNYDDNYEGEDEGKGKEEKDESLPEEKENSKSESAVLDESIRNRISNESNITNGVGLVLPCGQSSALSNLATIASMITFLTIINLFILTQSHNNNDNNNNIPLLRLLSFIPTVWMSKKLFLSFDSRSSRKALASFFSPLEGSLFIRRFISNFSASTIAAKGKQRVLPSSCSYCARISFPRRLF